MSEVISPRGRALSFKQACGYLGMPAERLRRLVDKQKIPVYRDGRLFFYERDLDEWLDAHRTPAIDEPKSKHIAMPTPRIASSGIEDLLPRKRRLWKHAS